MTPGDHEGPVIVTGATGFVGATLVAHLAHLGHTVVATDLRHPSALLMRYWHAVRSRIVLEAGDVRDAPWLEHVVDRHRPRAIVHGATVTALGRAREAEQLRSMIETNIMGTVNLLEAARQNRCIRIVLLSSSGVYGSTPLEAKLKEDAPLPTGEHDAYLVTKLSAEGIGRRYAVVAGLDVVVARIDGPYGPMEVPTPMRPIVSPLFQLVRGALTDGRVSIAGTDRPMPFTFTRDLADGICRLATAERLGSRLYNVSAGQSTYLSAALEILKDTVPEVSVSWVAPGSPCTLDLSSYPSRGTVDRTLLSRETGFQPQYSLLRGIRASLPWWRAALGA